MREQMKTHTRFLILTVLALCLLGTTSALAPAEAEETNEQELYAEEKVALLKAASDFSWKIEGDTLTIYTRLSGESMSTYKKK